MRPIKVQERDKLQCSEDLKHDVELTRQVICQIMGSIHYSVTY